MSMNKDDIFRFIGKLESLLDPNLVLFTDEDLEDGSFNVVIDKERAERRVSVVFMKDEEPYAWFISESDCSQHYIDIDSDAEMIVRWLNY